MLVYHGTSQENLLTMEEDEGVAGPSYWAGTFEQAKGYADSFKDGVVLACNRHQYDFQANMLVAQCLFDNGDLDVLPDENDLAYSLEYLEGIVTQDVVRNYDVVTS